MGGGVWDHLLESVVVGRGSLSQSLRGVEGVLCWHWAWYRLGMSCSLL